MTAPRLSTVAADSREHARTGTGEFGTQAHAESGIVEPSGSRRQHLAELTAALAAYDRHGSYTRYVQDLVTVLGYTQRNGFASKTLVSPTGAEFDLDGSHVNKTEPAQTMAILGIRLRLGHNPRKFERDFEAFLGDDGSWFMVDPKRG